jgi:hypothetical protein
VFTSRTANYDFIIGLQQLDTVQQEVLPPQWTYGPRDEDYDESDEDEYFDESERDPDFWGYTGPLHLGADVASIFRCRFYTSLPAASDEEFDSASSKLRGESGRLLVNAWSDCGPYLESRLTIPIMEPEPRHHWLLSTLARELDEEYRRIQAELQLGPENIQLSGHLAEKVWGRLLAEWLPPQYEFGFRRHLILEREADGKSRTGEVDLVLFHPAYPQRLRAEQEVLVSGVVAAFSVKATLDKSGLREAMDFAKLVRRGMEPRAGAIGGLISPLIVGVLAQSHRQLGVDPRKSVGELLMTAASDSEHPREELDLVCIADLECWTRNALVLWAGTQGHSVAVSTAAASGLALDKDSYIEAWTSRHPGAEGRIGEPVAALVSSLWAKLASRDASLRPIAEGFRLAKFTGVGGGKAQYRFLDPLVDAQTYAALRSLPSTIVD